MNARPIGETPATAAGAEAAQLRDKTAERVAKPVGAVREGGEAALWPLARHLSPPLPCPSPAAADTGAGGPARRTREHHQVRQGHAAAARDAPGNGACAPTLILTSSNGPPSPPILLERQSADDVDLEIDAVWFGMGLPFAGTDGRLAYTSTAATAAPSSSSSAPHAATALNSGRSGASAPPAAGVASLPPAVRRNSAALIAAVLSDDVALAPSVAGIAGTTVSQARSKMGGEGRGRTLHRRLDGLAGADGERRPGGARRQRPRRPRRRGGGHAAAARESVACCGGGHRRRHARQGAGMGGKEEPAAPPQCVRCTATVAAACLPPPPPPGPPPVPPPAPQRARRARRGAAAAAHGGAARASLSCCEPESEVSSSCCSRCCFPPLLLAPPLLPLQVQEMRAVTEKQRADEAKRLRRMRAQAAAAARGKGGSASPPPPAAAPAPSGQVCARCSAYVDLRVVPAPAPPSQAAAPLPAPFSTLPSERVVAGLLQLRRLSTTEFRPDDRHDAAAAAAAAAAGKGAPRGIPHPEDPRAALLRYDYDKRSPPFRLLTAAGASEDGGVEGFFPQSGTLPLPPPRRLSQAHAPWSSSSRSRATRATRARASWSRSAGQIRTPCDSLVITPCAAPRAGRRRRRAAR